MNLRLYRTDSDINEMEKKLQQINSVHGSLKEDTGLISPEFKLTKNVVGIDHVNYLFWEDVNRYYFCKPVLEVGGTCTLVCTVDLLMTYKDNLYNTEAVVLRSQSKRNAFLVDDQITVQNKTRIRDLLFQAGINKDTNYLITI